MKKGFSRARLDRLSSVVHERVDRGDAVGAVALLERDGEVFVDVVGAQDQGSRVPMRRDTIFRIASMTKPMVAVAAMSLVEEARLRLDDPVDELLPELAGRNVLRTPEGPLEDTVPAERSITMRDLLTFRIGIGTVFAREASYPLQAAIAEAKIGASVGTLDVSPDELMKRYGSLPAMHQPGTVWRYHNSYDALGVLVARAAGKPLAEVMHERVFGPLGMKDTGWEVPDEMVRRLATPYQVDRATKKLVPYGDSRDRSFRWQQPAGAAGLFSTADDVLAFGRMMRRFGMTEDGRLLARTTVEAMLTDQIPAAQKEVSPFFPGFWEGRGWGLGVAITTARTGTAAVPGRFGWDGGLGTTWFSDPRESLTGILLTQRVGNPFTLPLNVDFATLAYAALDD